MTIIEKLTLLANVYTQYLGNFINKKIFASYNNNLTVYHNYNGNINNTGYTFCVYSVYNKEDYIGDIIVYGDEQVAFKPHKH